MFLGLLVTVDTVDLLLWLLLTVISKADIVAVIKMCITYSSVEDAAGPSAH